MDLDELARLDRAHVLHPNSEFRRHEQQGPRIVTAGRGIRVQVNGRWLIDGLAGLYNVNVGHGRSEIAEAVAEQLRTLAYYPSYWDYSNEPAIRLAERIARLLPQDRKLRHLLFTTGGSDANEANFKIARYYHALRGEPARQKILSRGHSFHGMTRGAGSATMLPAYHVLSERDATHVRTAAPYCLRCDLGKEPASCNVACADDVATVIEREGPGTVAAVIAEPVLGTGGIVPPPAGYFARLQEVCRRHGVLLIADEVITGFGRTGRWFGMEHFGLHPDLVSFAKGITSGYLPLGGVALSDRVYEVLRDASPQGQAFMFGLTYSNHPVSCAAALANLDILERDNLVENARDVGTYLLAELHKAFDGHPLVAQIRGLGLLAAIETAQPGTSDPVGGNKMEYTRAIAQALYDRGLIARALWDNIALSPPLCTTLAEVDEIVSILVAGFAEITPRFVRS
jgi:putrescine---pyruvate transaminase